MAQAPAPKSGGDGGSSAPFVLETRFPLEAGDFPPIFQLELPRAEDPVSLSS